MMKRGILSGLVVAAVGSAVVLAQQPPGTKPNPGPAGGGQPPAKPAQPPAKPAQPGNAGKPATPEPLRGAQPQEHTPEMPGPEHAQLGKLAGEWTVTTTMEMGDMPKQESAGTASIKSALGGRFLHETAGGELMGDKTETFKVWGYNSASKKFESVWTWNMNTSLLHLTGDSKDGGRTIEWDVWYQKSPSEREEFKASTSMAHADHFVVKLHSGKMPDGSPGPVMTSTYTRKK
jgi:hypothetical protein